LKLAESSQFFSICRPWLEAEFASGKAFAVSTSVLASVVRVSTNSRVFKPPTPLGDAFAFAETMLSHPCCVVVEPGPRHWKIFKDLCIAANARDNLITDAWLAALAIEHDCTLVTLDSDFRKFPGLTHASPLIAP
jgi:uncharacterized protein